MDQGHLFRAAIITHYCGPEIQRMLPPRSLASKPHRSATSVLGYLLFLTQMICAAMYYVHSTYDTSYAIYQPETVPRLTR